MPNIFHQSIEDILKAATPEQRLLWNYIFLRWGERISVSQYVYSGLLSGELTAYSANKMYLAYSIFMSGTNTTGAATFNYLQTLNELNANLHLIHNAGEYWDDTAAAVRFTNKPIEVRNIFFSRLLGLGNPYIQFIGYRIGI